MGRPAKHGSPAVIILLVSTIAVIAGCSIMVVQFGWLDSGSGPFGIVAGCVILAAACIILYIYLADRKATSLLREIDSSLRKKTDELDALVKSTPGGVFRYSADDQARFSFVSDGMLTWLGYTSAEFEKKFGNCFYNMVWHEDLNRVKSEIEKQIIEDRYTTCEYRIQKSDGSLMWVHNVGHLVHDEDGQAWFYVVIVDISAQKDAEAELRARSKEDRIVLDQSGKSIIRFDMQKDEAFLTGNLVQICGLPTHMTDFPESLYQSGVIAPESLDELRVLFVSMSAGVPTGSCIVEASEKSSRRAWIAVDYSLVKPDSGASTRSVISLADCTQHHKQELDFQKMKHEFGLSDRRSLLYVEADITDDVVKHADVYQGKAEYYFDGAPFQKAMKEAARVHLDDENLAQMVELLDPDRLSTLFSKGITSDRMDYQATFDGNVLWNRVFFKLVRDPESDHLMLFASVIDVSEEYSERIRLKELADRDAMTGLLTHQATEKAIEEALKNMRPGNLGALFMVDLDDFKQVNDRKGHQAGDRLLCTMANSLASAFRKGDIVGRIGGDEFMAFMVGNLSEQLIETKTSSLLNALQFSVEELNVTVSIGVAVVDDSDAMFENLYAAADTALYQAKNAGKAQYRMVDSECCEYKPEGTAGESSAVVQYKSILDHMDGGVLIIQVGDTIETAYESPSVAKTLRISGRAADEKLSMESILAEDRPSAEAAIRQTAQTGQVTDCTYRMAYDENRWSHLRIAPLSRHADGTAAVIALLSDATELKQSEAKLRMEDERYRIAAELSGAMVWEVDITTRTLYQSLEVSHVIGHTATVIHNVPEGILKIDSIHPASIPDFKRMFTDLFDGIEGKDYAILTRRAHEGYMWLNASFRLIRNEEGKPIRSVGVLKEVAKTGGNLQEFESEVCFADSAAPTMIGVARINLSTKTLDALISAGTTTADTSLDDLQTAFASFLNEGDRKVFECDLAAVLSTGEFEPGQTWKVARFWLNYPDGRIRCVSLETNILQHPRTMERYAFCYLRDVDRFIKYEKMLDEPVGYDPETLLYDKDTLTRLYPIALDRMEEGKKCGLAVFELVDFKRFKAKSDSDVVRRLLFSIGRLCRAFIEGDGSASRIDEARFVIFSTDFDSRESVRRLVDHFKEHLKRGLEQFDLDVDMDISFGYVLVTQKNVTLHEMLRRATIASHISKDRPGVAATEYSEPGKLALLPKSLSSATSQDKRRILIADDSKASRLLLYAFLKDDYLVDEAEDGEEALRLLHERAYSLFLCDIQMPRKNGWEVLGEMRLKNMLADTPVVVITADSTASSEVKALRLGASDVVRKPFVADTLSARVRNIIGRKEAAEEAERNRAFELRFQQQASLLKTAEYDDLTGILNKQGFYRQARDRLRNSAEESFYLIRFDIDSFKTVNEVMGITAGDKLLRQIGRILRESDSHDGVFARLQSDHFVILHKADKVYVNHLFKNVEDGLAAYSPAYRVGVHVGVYDIEDSTIDVSIMCDRALVALKSVKSSMTKHVAYFDNDLRERIVQNRQMTSQMPFGLENEQFVLYYQPQVDYEGKSITSAEALVRWNHPTKGLLAPGAFIPLFEENGLITQLDQYIWEHACRFLSQRKAAGLQIVPVSVNISRRDIYNIKVSDFIFGLIRTYDLDPSLIHVEITESAYSGNDAQLIETVDALRAGGLQVEIDDFGSGYSSLNTLAKMPADVVKLDLKFLDSGTDKGRSAQVLEYVVSMSHTLRLAVLAEGVERKEQADFLDSIGCTKMQGYYFSHPLPQSEFEELLDGRRSVAAFQDPEE